MGTDIRGWVEGNKVNLSDHDCWFAIININLLVYRDYAIFGKLFGVRNREKAIPVAPKRGAPDDISIDGRELLQPGNFLHSWILYEELEPHLSELSYEYDWGWRFVFESMKTFAEQYGEGNVRLVVAFDEES